MGDSTTTIYQIRMPAGFYELTPEQIKVLCEMNDSKMFPTMPPWESMNESSQRFYRCTAWWRLMGVADPGSAAMAQSMGEGPIDEDWDVVCRRHGWRVWHPRTYSDLESEFLPKPKPNIRLIMARCPQMALLRTLGGSVSEPYWWAGLSITEHAEPNLSKECSDGYPGYSDAELEYRKNRIKSEGTKPALCSRMDSVNPLVCGTCRFMGVINSPIALGYEHEPKWGRNV